MFIGHFGVGFGAKATASRVSLGMLFLAAQFIDLLWPTLLLLGIERVRIAPGSTRVTPLDFEHYPVSHSLLAVLGWALLLGVGYYFLYRNRRGSLVIGLLMVSHWLLDAVVHRPDLPLYPGSNHLVGLSLWSSLGATLIVELAIFGLGVWFYWSLHPGYRYNWQVGFPGPHSVPRDNLLRQRLWFSAAKRDCLGVGGASPMAAGGLGLLDRPAPRTGGSSRETMQSPRGTDFDTLMWT